MLKELKDSFEVPCNLLHILEPRLFLEIFQIVFKMIKWHIFTDLSVWNDIRLDGIFISIGNDHLKKTGWNGDVIGLERP